ASCCAAAFSRKTLPLHFPPQKYSTADSPGTVPSISPTHSRSSGRKKPFSYPLPFLRSFYPKKGLHFLQPRIFISHTLTIRISALSTFSSSTLKESFPPRFVLIFPMRFSPTNTS